jgi:hypothetical protein
MRSGAPAAHAGRQLGVRRVLFHSRTLLPTGPCYRLVHRVIKDLRRKILHDPRGQTLSYVRSRCTHSLFQLASGGARCAAVRCRPQKPSSLRHTESAFGVYCVRRPAEVAGRRRGDGRRRHRGFPLFPRRLVRPGRLPVFWSFLPCVKSYSTVTLFARLRG